MSVPTPYGGLHVPEGVGTPATHNTPYRAGKGFIYEGGLRVPLIVRWPGQVPEGLHCRRHRSATVAAQLGSGRQSHDSGVEVDPIHIGLRPVAAGDGAGRGTCPAARGVSSGRSA